MKEHQIVSLNIGKPRKLVSEDKEYVSGVGKLPVAKAYLTTDGFKDDGVHITKAHGGPDRTVLLFCHDHYETLEKEYGKALKMPAFGENITVSGLLEEDVYIGDVYKIGESIVQVSQPRNPCNTLSKYNDESRLLARLVDTGYTGYLARTLQEGWIYKDSAITLLERKSDSVSVSYSNMIYFHERENIEGIKRLLSVEELSAAWRKELTKRLQTIDN